MFTRENTYYRSFGKNFPTMEPEGETVLEQVVKNAQRASFLLDILQNSVLMTSYPKEFCQYFFFILGIP